MRPKKTFLIRVYSKWQWCRGKCSRLAQQGVLGLFYLGRVTGLKTSAVHQFLLCRITRLVGETEACASHSLGSGSTKALKGAPKALN